MDQKIILSFTENHKYQLDFSPPVFWKAFADTYNALPWERGEDKLAVIAENYSYLLDLLVQARLFYLSGKQEDPHFQ